MPPILRQTKECGGLDLSKPPQSCLGVSKWLLYDGFFLFAVVRQFYINDRIIMRSYA